MKKRTFTILIAFIMAFTMSVQTCAVFAETEEEIPFETYEYKKLSDEEVNAFFNRLDVSAGGVSSSIIGTLFKEIAKAAGLATVKWGTDKLLNSMFGSEDSSINYMTDMLEVMADKQNEIIDKMNECTELIEMTQYQDIIREYEKQSSGTAWLAKQCTATLAYIDEKYEDKHIDGKLPEEYEQKIANDRLAALTNGIGITNYQSAVEPIDTRVGELHQMLTTIYSIPVGKDLSARRNLYQVYREKLRLDVDWEHLAYDDMEAFNNYMTENYIAAVVVEIASLKARYAICEQKNLPTDSLKVRLDNLYEEAAEVQQLYNSNRVSRDYAYRHFWKPDHEVYLLADIKRQYIPQENTGDISSQFRNTKGYPDKTLNMDFWNQMYEPIRVTSGYTGLSGDSVLMFDKNDSKNKFGVETSGGMNDECNYVYAKGVPTSQQNTIGTARKIPTYMYFAGYNVFSYYVVYDKRSDTDEYFSLGVKCSHDWHTHWKGLNELGECTKCGATFIDTMPALGDSRDSYRIENTEITADNCIYNGKKQTPDITVKNGDGKILEEGTDYLISGGRKDVGKGNVTIEGLGEYKSVAEKSFKINPKGTDITKLSRNGRNLTVKWKKQAAKMSKSRVTGYQLRYSTSSKMKNAKTVTVRGYSKTAKKLANLKKSKKYYVQVRTYRKIGEKTYCSDWSKRK